MSRLKNLCFKILEKISPDLSENIKGDLEEVHQRALRTHGKRKATWLFFIEWLTCMKLLLNRRIQPPWTTTSFYSGLKMSWRVLIKNKSYSLISLFGLTIGLVATFLVFLFVKTELSYDRHHSKADRIYRIVYDLTERNEKLPWAITTGKWAPLITDQFPEVESFVRISPTWGSKSLIKTEKTAKGYYEEGFMWADSTITTVFDFEILAGDPKNPIARPNTIMISEDIAVKFFGSVEEAIGNPLNRDNETDYMVTSVFRKMPSTSHFHAQMIASIMTGTTNEERSKFWNYSYIVLQDGADPDQLAAGFPELIQTHTKEETVLKLILQPLTSIYLQSQLMYEFEPVGNRITTQLFTGVGLFILLIACINFINLSTAYGAKRTKEIGLKKTMGAHRYSLIKQLIMESMLITLFAVMLAIVLSYLLIPSIELLINKSLEISYLWSLENGMILLGLILFVGILSGAYPAFYISSHRPTEIFAKTNSKGKQYLRKGLSIFQFAMSIALIAGSIVVYQQLRFFQSKDMGMQTEQALVIPLNYALNLGDSYEAFRTKAMQNPHVVNMSLMSSLPGELIRMWVGNVRPSYGTDADKLRVKIFHTDYDFISTLGINLLEGRNYSRDFATDTTNAVIINQTAATALGITNIDTASIYSYSPTQLRDLKVVGIVEDFHFASLHSTIEPLVIYNKRGTEGKGKLVIRLDTEDLPETLAYIEEVWNMYEPDRTMESFFLDEYFQLKYTKEQTTMKLLVSFTVFAVFIACLGLFGLATYVMQNRQKEVGVRKVLGASMGQLLVLLTKEFVWLILVAFLIISPLIYYLLDYWLMNFAYRIDINVLVFVLAILMVLIPAILSISLRSIQVARVNPSEVLAQE